MLGIICGFESNCSSGGHIVHPSTHLSEVLPDTGTSENTEESVSEWTELNMRNKWISALQGVDLVIATGARSRSPFHVGAKSGPLSRCCECELLIAQRAPFARVLPLPRRLSPYPDDPWPVMLIQGHTSLVPSKQNQLRRTRRIPKLPVEPG